jgi:serine/threonine-protein kinase
MSTVHTGAWRRAAILFERALDQPPELREEFLHRVCGGDHDLRTAVESLLALDEEAEDVGSESLPDAGLPLPSASPHLEGYRLLEPIGHGGMGRVWLAERAVDDVWQRVAIKLMELAGHPGMLRLFRRERQILARLEHPNIARFLDGGTTEDGIPFVVLEYVEGAPVTEACDARQLGVRQRLELFLKICRVVQYAHESLVVHSDLKPRNVLVTDAGEPKLLDFGIARLLDRPRNAETTMTRARFLTPEYASPEQIAGQPVSTASDVYSLGVILYELLTGRRPYGRFSWPRLAGRGEAGPLPPSEAVRAPAGDLSPGEMAGLRGVSVQRLRRQLRGDVDQIVLRCLRVDPRERYRSVEQLAEDLRRHLAGLPVLTRPPRLGYRLGKLVRRQWPVVAVAALLAVSLAALLAVIVTSSQRVTLERDRALRSQREAEQVNRFLVDSFRLADPDQLSDFGRPAGAEVTARDILVHGTARLSELRDEPRVQARLKRTLGEVYAHLGLYQDAIPLVRQALAVQRTLPEEAARLDTIESLRTLGFARERLGQLPAAELALRRAVALSRDAGDEWQLAESLLEWGRLLGEKNDYRGAEAALGEAVGLRRQQRPPDPQSLGRVLLVLGEILRLDRQQEAAEPTLREALALLVPAVGEEDSAVAVALYNLGLIQAGKGASGAEALLRRSIAIWQKLYGPEHPETLTALSGLANYYYLSGRYTEAETLLRELLARDRKIKGPRHPDVAKDLSDLVAALWAQGDFAAAEPLIREALGIARESWGPENPGTLRYALQLGLLLSEEGAASAAEPLLREVLEQRRKALGPQNVGVAVPSQFLAELLARTGRLREALDLARQAEAIYAHELPENHWRTAMARSILGDCLVRLHRFAEAEPLLLSSLETLERTRGNGTERQARRTRERIVRLYEAWGRPRQAVAYRVRTARSHS